MADHHDLLKCPLCQGHGELLREELIAQLRTVELRSKIEAYLAEVDRPEAPAELVAVEPCSRDFQKDVHSWNPQLPMWRRSPKE